MRWFLSFFKLFNRGGIGDPNLRDNEVAAVILHPEPINVVDMTDAIRNMDDPTVKWDNRLIFFAVNEAEAKIAREQFAGDIDVVVQQRIPVR